jgi:soluble lytic murein transglycosylase-like protein
MPRSINLLLALIFTSFIVAAQEPDGVAQQRQSLFMQRASLKRQMGEAHFNAAVGTTFYGALNPAFYMAASAPCPPLNPAIRESLIFDAARTHGLDPDLLRAVMHRESGFRPCAVSMKGALGVMQLMPSTLVQFHVRDPFDPAQSIRAGAGLLRNLLDRYDGDVKHTLAAYNAGAARIDNADPETYPDETKSYIAAIAAELGLAPR